MKTSAILAACASGLAVQAFSVPRIAQDAAQQVQGFMSPEQYLIELAPGETKWVTDAEKWALRRVCRSRIPLRGYADQITGRHLVLRYHRHA